MIVSLLVVGLVVLAGVLLFKDKIKAKVAGKIDNKINEEVTEKAAEKVNEPEAAVVIEENLVKLTDQGFLPESITVKKGTVVRFVNETTGPMSIASDPHPAHTDYPGFDQFKSSFAGKAEYDFTFEKVGTWGYHNHLSPDMKGTVVVE